jgi:hypothetical protein
MATKETRKGRATMQVGDRILVNRGIGKEVYIVARVEVPHSPEKAFASKSGFDFTIGVKVWRSDYVWNEKNRIWVRRD